MHPQPTHLCTATSLLLLLLPLVGCAGYASGDRGFPDVSAAQPNVASLQPQDWYIFYSSKLGLHPSSDADGAWSFEFPSYQAGGHVNYIETPFTATVPLHNLTVVFEVESDAPQYVVIDTTDHPPATCRLMIEQKNDDLGDPNGRWWANASTYNLGSQDNQILTFTIPLTSAYWTNVVGQHDAVALAAALSNIGWVGMTFGGQYFAGHGVAISGGSAEYVLISYSVE